jgi:hypothetical protein
MRYLVSLFVAAVILCAIVLPASARHPNVTVKMLGQNGSREWGTATLSDLGSKTGVIISLKNEAAPAIQPAHIHVGPCARLGAVKYPLTDVVHGYSHTIVNAPIAALLNSHLAINVHKSSSQLGAYVSCGNIP